MTQEGPGYHKSRIEVTQVLMTTLIPNFYTRYTTVTADMAHTFQHKDFF